MTMRELNGSELAGFIKERQAKQVRALRQAWHINPRLAIVTDVENPVIETYMRLKQRYVGDEFWLRNRTSDFEDAEKT